MRAVDLFGQPVTAGKPEFTGRSIDVIRCG
jgi:hypothetical protein